MSLRTVLRQSRREANISSDEEIGGRRVDLDEIDALDRRRNAKLRNKSASASASASARKTKSKSKKRKRRGIEKRSGSSSNSSSKLKRARRALSDSDAASTANSQSRDSGSSDESIEGNTSFDSSNSISNSDSAGSARGSAGSDADSASSSVDFTGSSDDEDFAEIDWIELRDFLGLWSETTPTGYQIDAANQKTPRYYMWGTVVIHYEGGGLHPDLTARQGQALELNAEDNTTFLCIMEVARIPESTVRQLVMDVGHQFNPTEPVRIKNTGYVGPKNRLMLEHIELWVRWLFRQSEVVGHLQAKMSPTEVLWSKQFDKQPVGSLDGITTVLFQPVGFKTPENTAGGHELSLFCRRLYVCPDDSQGGNLMLPMDGGAGDVFKMGLDEKNLWKWHNPRVSSVSAWFSELVAKHATVKRSKWLALAKARAASQAPEETSDSVSSRTVADIQVKIEHGGSQPLSAEIEHPNHSQISANGNPVLASSTVYAGGKPKHANVDVLPAPARKMARTGEKNGKISSSEQLSSTDTKQNESAENGPNVILCADISSPPSLEDAASLTPRVALLYVLAHWTTTIDGFWGNDTLAKHLERLFPLRFQNLATTSLKYVRNLIRQIELDGLLICKTEKTKKFRRPKSMRKIREAFAAAAHNIMVVTKDEDAEQRNATSKKEISVSSAKPTEIHDALDVQDPQARNLTAHSRPNTATKQSSSDVLSTLDKLPKKDATSIKIAEDRVVDSLMRSYFREFPDVVEVSKNEFMVNLYNVKGDFMHAWPSTSFVDVVRSKFQRYCHLEERQVAGKQQQVIVFNSDRVHTAPWPLPSYSSTLSSVDQASLLAQLSAMRPEATPEYLSLLMKSS